MTAVTDVLIRRCASGIMVAEPHVRDRDGKPEIATRRRRHYRTPTAAISAALERLALPDAAPESSGSPDRAQSERAQGRAPSLDRLKPQARKAVRLMRERGGLTRLEAMYYGIGNLPARVGEIRAEFGADAVETCPVEDANHCTYRWRGPDSLQAELEVA